MERRISMKPLVLRILIWLFSFSVSMSVIPSNSIGIFGLFGDLVVEVTQTQTEEAVSNHKEFKLLQKAKHKVKSLDVNHIQLQIDLEWLLFIIFICLMAYISYSYSLPNLPNPITLKVRMDN